MGTNDTKHRILFILENFYPLKGGVETLFFSLCRSLSQHGHEVHVLTNRTKQSMPKEETIAGIHIHRSKLINRYIFTFFAWIPALKWAKQVDLIHTTSYNAGLPAKIAGFLCKKPVLITFHEYWGALWRRLPYSNRVFAYLHQAFEKFLTKLSFKYFIAVSHATASALKSAGVKDEKIKMIYNGIDYEAWQPLSNEQKDDSTFTFLYFGRVGISKGLNLILPAYKELIAQGIKNIQLKFVFSQKNAGFLPSFLRALEQLPHEHQPIILYELARPDLQQAIQMADAVLIPSYSEGFCYAAVETTALHTGIISSNQAALKETVSGKHINMTSLSSTALAEAMKKALNQQWDYSPPKKFNLSDTLAAYVQLYDKMLNKKEVHG